MKHGDERNYRRESSWTALDGQTSDGKPVPLGHGITVSVVDRWCACCEEWIPCKGLLGALTFQLEHEHGEGR